MARAAAGVIWSEEWRDAASAIDTGDGVPHAEDDWSRTTDGIGAGDIGS